jgi:hypothetical protein
MNNSIAWAPRPWQASGCRSSTPITFTHYHNGLAVGNFFSILTMASLYLILSQLPKIKVMGFFFFFFFWCGGGVYFLGVRCATCTKICMHVECLYLGTCRVAVATRLPLSVSFGIHINFMKNL